MTQVTIPYQFQNQTTADANQVDQNFSALANTINGNLDDSNMKPASLTKTSINVNALGVPQSQDVYTNPCVVSGLALTKDGSVLNQVDLSAGVAYLKQSDGTFLRFSIQATNFKTISTSATYYLDLQHDGSFSWATGHSTDSVSYLNLATVTSDGSGNVSVVTPNAQTYQVQLNGAGGGGGGAGNPNLW